MVDIQYSSPTTLASTRTSLPSRVMSIQKAWVLAFARQEIARALDDQVDGQPNASIEFPAQPDDVQAGISLVQIGRENARHFLEERVVIMPRHQVRDLDAAILGQLNVDLGLG